MLSRNFYEIVHIVGIALMFVAIGGVSIHAANGGTKATSSTRKFIAIWHGIGTLLVLVGGFGMLARLGMTQMSSLPAWLWIKVLIWLVLGGLTFLPYRRPALAKPLFVVLPVLAGIAVYMAVYKPIF